VLGRRPGPRAGTGRRGPRLAASRKGAVSGPGPHEAPRRPSPALLASPAAMQKFGSSTLNKPKRNAGEIKEQVVQPPKSAAAASQLAAASALGSRPCPCGSCRGRGGKGKAGAMEGIDKKKMEMHIEYCKHVLDKTKQHLEVAEREEQQERQKQEVARLQLQAEAEAQREAEARRAEEERARREAEEEEAQRKGGGPAAAFGEWEKRKERVMPPVGAGEDGGAWRGKR